MPQPTPILAATDFSAPARHAADRAARLAHQSGASLALVHVLPAGSLHELRQWLGAGHASEQLLQADAQRQLEQLANELHQARQVQVGCQARSGDVTDEILAAARALHAGLLVLGARGAGFLRHLLVGTTSEKLLRRTSQPVLLVRQAPRAPYRRVLLPLDFSPWSAPALAAARLAAPGARLFLLHAFAVPFEEKLRFAGVDAATVGHYRQQARTQAVAQVAALAASAGLRAGHWESVVVEGDASLRIVEHEQALDCDLVVLGKHGRSATEDLLLGSVTRHVMAEGSADLLLSPAHDG